MVSFVQSVPQIFCCLTPSNSHLNSIHLGFFLDIILDYHIFNTFNGL
jgi:hypothetical protein